MKSSRNLPDNISSALDLPDQLRNAIFGVPFPADMKFDIRYAIERGVVPMHEGMRQDRICWIKGAYELNGHGKQTWAEFMFGVDCTDEEMYESMIKAVSGVEGRLRAAMAGMDMRSPLQKAIDYASNKFRDKFGFAPSNDMMTKMFDDAPD